MRNRGRVAAMVIVAGVLANVVWWRGRIEAASVTASGREVALPMRLADTGLYTRNGGIAPAVQPFAPQYPLWTDGAAKRRWVSLPDGAVIDARDVDAWSFPVGTKFWKEFSFGGRKIETRMLWRTSADRWAFASYLWNADGTDAIKAADEGVMNVAEVAPGKFHSIPSVAECRACHDSGRTEILGFNALQLSTDRDPNALHGEPLEAGMVTLATLHAAGRLVPQRPELVANPPRIEASSAEERTVLGYLAANCGMCHTGSGELAPLGLTWKHSELRANGAAIARAMVGRATKWQVPGVTGESVLINPDRPDESALLRRMRSRRPSSQMPPLGTALSDREAVDAVTRWISARAESPSRQTR